MGTAYGENGEKIGEFHGAFVLNSSGSRIYWVDDGEVFARTTFGGELGIAHKVWSMIGEFDGQIASNESGSAIFTIN